MGKQIQALFCDRFLCSIQQYENRAFAKCLYWHAKPVAPLLRTLNPGFFRRDYILIRRLGEATDLHQALAEALSFHATNRANPSFLRTSLRIRVSGRKAVRLAHLLLAEAPEAGAGTN